MRAHALCVVRLLAVGVTWACTPDGPRLSSTRSLSGGGAPLTTGGTTAVDGGLGSAPHRAGSATTAFDAGLGCVQIVDPEVDLVFLLCPASIGSQWPFVRAVFSVTDAVSTASLYNSAPGKLCMSGILANGGPNWVNWGAFIGLNFVEWNEDYTALLSWLDAEAFGIVQMQFTLESPPPQIGVTLGLNTVTRTQCPDSTANCSNGGRFRLMAGDQSFAYSTPGVKGPLPLTAFSQPPWESSTLALDVSRLAGLEFVLGSNPGAALEYDFCISDLKFLDAYGNEVIDTLLADAGNSK